MPATNITIRRRYATSRRRVFDAWTRPQHLRRWAFGGACKATKSVRVDLFPGGEWELILRGGPGRSKRWGIFREIHAPDRLTFTWTSEDADGQAPPSRVTLQIDGGESEASLTLTHAGLPESDCEAKRAEWNRLLEALEGFLGPQSQTPDTAYPGG